MPQQLSFELPVKPALGRGDFFVSPANALAVAMIDLWNSWPEGKLALSGPAGSGKTHLTHVWAAMSGATILPAAALPGRDLAALAAGPVAVEDVPDIADDGAVQTALFHLHNLLRAASRPLLLTGRGAPAHWGLGLPDLQSRVSAAHHCALEPPDDSLLAAVLAKLFADRQVTPRPDVIPYVITRMDRSFAAAAEIVDRLDRVALAESRALSRPLAVRLLDADAA
ncbi:DnaA ATPase domain-containing protein [Pukyongiella litopenaei]|uniref:Chromosomal replication initiator DnaA n=1 Tax=Pukyongiella litopenaei TaxID=2605946 RepID=A0A2S0MUN7_9RHOB|nr:DnaA/Hda family protein [Pukyongiella litopenaei]AVO39588.1 chromosomal replication initiator DnaA [Pukyongiella litopenaei]